MLLLLAAACSDYKLNGDRTQTPPFDDTETTPTVPTDTDTTPPPEEVCNGDDDDGDGAVDEDFPDVDADGTADCVDEDCAVDVVAAGTVALSDTCTGAGTVKDPWTDVATNVWTALSTNSRVQSIAQTPLVVQLTDDDGDGDVDADDTVDVAFLAWDNAGSSAAAHLVVLESGTWTEELDLPGFYFAGEIATGDLNGDGFPEVLGYDGGNDVHAYEMDGTELWSIGPLTTYMGGEPSLAVVDLDGDGVPEVLAQEAVLAGPTGDVLTSLPARTFSYTQHVVADLDRDGVGEIVYDGDVHTADGTRLWEGLSAGSAAMVHSMVLDVDGDPEGEVVMASDAALAIYDTDGTPLMTTAFGGGLASVPCAGDFDGDGAVEIALPAQSRLHLFELDGTETWSAPILDTSTMAGCVGGDLDGDGALEVIYADEVSLLVLDGRTGAARITHTEHASGTLTETPAVVDLDGDGTSEILLGSNDNMGRDTWIGLTLVEHAGDGWAPGTRDWPANARVDGRFDASGAVVDVGTWWERENSFRAVASETPALLRDVRLDIDDVCVASCAPDGAVSVSVQVHNPGRTTIPAETEVVLSRVDGGVATEVARLPLGADLASGASSASLVFALTTADLGAEGLEVGLAGDAADCHPEDDTARWSDPICP